MSAITLRASTRRLESARYISRLSPALRQLKGKTLIPSGHCRRPRSSCPSWRQRGHSSLSTSNGRCEPRHAAHFGDTISTQLVNSRPTHYIDGTAITVLAWRAWLNAADAGTLSHSVRQATHRPARETTIFATIRWMYYALWCQRITLETMSRNLVELYPTKCACISICVPVSSLLPHATPADGPHLWCNAGRGWLGQQSRHRCCLPSPSNAPRNGQAGSQRPACHSSTAATAHRPYRLARAFAPQAPPRVPHAQDLWGGCVDGTRIKDTYSFATSSCVPCCNSLGGARRMIACCPLATRACRGAPTDLRNTLITACFGGALCNLCCSESVASPRQVRSSATSSFPFPPSCSLVLPPPAQTCRLSHQTTRRGRWPR
ncbi:hypothetical protein BJY59DRAFT_545672 [Rhodotorula toruloides]